MSGSTDFVLEGAYTGDFIDLVLANTRGVVDWFFPSTDRATTERNYAPSGLAGAVVGAPTYANNAVRFKSQSDYVTLGSGGTTDVSIIAAVRCTDDFATVATQPTICSNWTTNVSGLLFGSTLTGGVPQLLLRRAIDNAGTPTNSGAHTLPWTNPTSWKLVAARAKGGAGGYLQIADLTANVASTPLSETRPPILGPAMRLGSALASSLGNIEVAGYVRGNVIWTAQEEADMAAQIAAFLAEHPTPITNIYV